VAIRERFSNLRDQILWNVDREPLALEPTIQGMAGMAFSTCARGAVLADARTLPQGQRSSSGWNELLDGSLEPPRYLLGCLWHVCVLSGTRTSYASPNHLSRLLLFARVLHSRPRDASTSCTRGPSMVPSGARALRARRSERTYRPSPAKRCFLPRPNDGSSHRGGNGCREPSGGGAKKAERTKRRARGFKRSSAQDEGRQSDFGGKTRMYMKLAGQFG
jgi:hypothetical protein